MDQIHNPPTTVDRTGWAAGPWDDEPDRLSWKTRSGYHAMVARMPATGTLSGYVGVPEGDPHYGRDHTSLGMEIGMAEFRLTTGGVTIQEMQPPRPKHWWFGFHTAHGNQYAPACSRQRDGIPARTMSPNETYWDIGMVISTCEHLAAELRHLNSGQQ